MAEVRSAVRGKKISEETEMKIEMSFDHCKMIWRHFFRILQKDIEAIWLQFTGENCTMVYRNESAKYGTIRMVSSDSDSVKYSH